MKNFKPTGLRVSTLAYSKPFIEGVHWFDFVDPYYFIESGGLLRNTKGETKAAYDRLKSMIAGWKSLKKGAEER